MPPVIRHASTAGQAALASPADHHGTDAWLNELPALLWRYAELGIVQDVGQMDWAELHGVYLYLSRLQRTSRN